MRAVRYTASMDMLNDKPVILRGNCLFRTGDRVVVAGSVPLIITASDAAEPTITVSGAGGGFSVDVAGFTPGLSMASEAKGNLGNGQLILVLTLANRVAELRDGAVYKVDYLIAERAA